MNMNEFRAMAYTKNENNQNTNENKNPVIKKFEFTKLSNDSLKNNSFEKKQEENLSKNIKELQKIKNEEKNQKENKKVQNDDRLQNATEYLKKGGLLKVPVEEKSSDGKDSVYRRVAKFLLIIGEDEAAKILPHLPENQIEKIIPEIASIRTVNKEETAQILEEFNELVENSKKQGGIETARLMLEKAYGKNRANNLINKTVPKQNEKFFDYLNDENDKKIQKLLEGENIGVQTIVLAHINPQKAANIINKMDDQNKKNVILRLANFNSVDSEIIRRIDNAMHEKLKNLSIESEEIIDGRNALAKILKKMDLSSENEIIKNLSTEDPDLGRDIKDRLFTLDDVIFADDKYLQNILWQMSEKDIAFLIATKKDEFREKILQNVSTSRKTEIIEQEEILKPMRKSDCDKITTDFITKIRYDFERGIFKVQNRDDEKWVE